jgi:His-Xaa-Ser system protein HxsD
MSTHLFELSEKYYSRDAIKEALYWLSNKYPLFISPSEKPDTIILCSESKLENETIGHIIQIINDYQLRECIKVETKNIKDIIIAKAFYPDNIIVPEPYGDLRDPVEMDQDETK